MTYEGLLETIRKIVFIDKDGGLTSKEFNEIFPGMNKAMVLELSPYEIYARVKEYEDNNEVKVGDIVKDKMEYITYLVLDDCVDENGSVYLFSENACVEKMNKKCLYRVKKTEYVDRLIQKLRAIGLTTTMKG